MKCSTIVIGQWKPRKITCQTIKKDFDLSCLSLDMVYDRVLWHCLIHVANPTSWRRLLLLLLYCH